jgi:protein TonB
LDPQPASSNRVPFQPETLQPEDPRIAIPGALQPDPVEAARLDDNADAEVQPVPAEPDHANEAAGSKRKRSLAFAASLVFHVAVAAMLILAPESILPPRPLTDIEGADKANQLLFGNDEADASVTGQHPDVTDVTVVPKSELPPQLQPQPQVAAPTEPIQQHKEQAQPPTEQEQQATEPSPDVLASPRTAEEKNSFTTLERRPTAKLEILRPVMPEPSEAERQLTEPRKPAPEAQTTPQRPAQPASGSGGQAETEALLGANEGREGGDSAVSGIGTAQTEAGNAAASNYRGLVQRKLNRASRRVSQAAQAKAVNNALVSFVTTANGGVVDVRLVRSSGSVELDKFAVELVKSVAPYPAIPPETGNKTWPFTVQIGPFL